MKHIKELRCYEVRSEKAGDCQESNPGHIWFEPPVPCYGGLWGGLWLSGCCWLCGRALAAQARGVLGSTLSDCQPFHSPLFSPHNILNFFIFSVRQDVLSMPRSGQSSVKSVNLFFLSVSGLKLSNAVVFH